MRSFVLALVGVAVLSNAVHAQLRGPDHPKGSGLGGRFVDADLTTLPADVERLVLRGRFGYGSDEITEAGVAELPRFKKLRVLHLGAFHFSDRIIESVAKLENLEELHLDSNHLTGAGFEQLAGLKKLRRLNLNFNPLRAESYDRLAKLTGLTHLLLYSTPEPTDDHMLEKLSALRNLEVLDLPGFSKGVTDAGVDHLVKLQKLTRVSLSQAAITDAGMAKLATLSNLRGLTLSEIRHVTPAGAKEIGNLRELRTLTIVDVRLDGNAIQAIGSLDKLERLELWNVSPVPLNVDRLAKIPTLVEFRSNEPLTSEGIRSLGKCPNLVSIVDGVRNATDEDLKSLTSLTKLESLRLDGDKLTRASLPTLAQMKSLRWLAVSRAIEVTPTEWRRLGDESLPYCEIVPNQGSVEPFHKAQQER